MDLRKSFRELVFWQNKSFKFLVKLDERATQILFKQKVIAQEVFPVHKVAKKVNEIDDEDKPISQFVARKKITTEKI